MNFVTKIIFLLSAIPAYGQVNISNNTLSENRAVIRTFDDKTQMWYDNVEKRLIVLDSFSKEIASFNCPKQNLNVNYLEFPRDYDSNFYPFSCDPNDFFSSKYLYFYSNVSKRFRSLELQGAARFINDIDNSNRNGLLIYETEPGFIYHKRHTIAFKDYDCDNADLSIACRSTLSDRQKILEPFPLIKIARKELFLFDLNFENPVLLQMGIYNTSYNSSGCGLFGWYFKFAVENDKSLYNRVTVKLAERFNANLNKCEFLLDGIDGEYIGEIFEVSQKNDEKNISEMYQKALNSVKEHFGARFNLRRLVTHIYDNFGKNLEPAWEVIGLDECLNTLSATYILKSGDLVGVYGDEYSCENKAQ